TFRVVCDDCRLAAPADGSLDRFMVPARTPDVEVRAGWTDMPAAVRGRVVFESGASWQLREARGAWVFAFHFTGDPLPYKTALFDSSFADGDVRLSRPHFAGRGADAVYALQYPLDELLMIHQLAQGKGVEIHGCAVVNREQRAYVFAGQSGAGKSTFARLWQN